MSAYGLRARTASGEIVWPTSSEYTRHSRTRRAISCEYCPPRSITSTGLSSVAGNGITFGSAAIVRRLFRDRHVVRMRLAQARAGDAHEACILQLVDGRRAAVAHGLAQPTDELVHDRRERPLVRDAPLDALGHELVDVFDIVLEVAVLREAARLHGAERAHAAILLEALALMDDHLARRLVGACEHRAEHHRVGTRGDRLRDVAGGRDAAVADQGNVDRLCDVVNRGDLRNADPGYHASRTDTPRPDTCLQAVGACFDERLRGLA